MFHLSSPKSWSLWFLQNCFLLVTLTAPCCDFLIWVATIYKDLSDITAPSNIPFISLYMKTIIRTILSHLILGNKNKSLVSKFLLSCCVFLTLMPHSLWLAGHSRLAVLRKMAQNVFNISYSQHLFSWNHYKKKRSIEL